MNFEKKKNHLATRNIHMKRGEKKPFQYFKIIVKKTIECCTNYSKHHALVFSKQTHKFDGSYISRIFTVETSIKH